MQKLPQSPSTMANTIGILVLMATMANVMSMLVLTAGVSQSFESGLHNNYIPACKVTAELGNVAAHSRTPHLMLGQFTEVAIFSQGQLPVVPLPPGAEEVAHVEGKGADAMVTMDSPQCGGGSDRLLVAIWRKCTGQDSRVKDHSSAAWGVPQ